VQVEIREESLIVIDWRVRMLIKAGYTRKAAVQIAESTYIDLHEACKLISKCEEKLALKILL
jgi:hypothetical protein